MKIYVTSAFTKDDKGGNKAGIVFNHPELCEKDKKEISAYLGYSETAFVTNSDKADLKLEYFTPVDEVPLCGHATIATFSTLYHLNELTKKNYTIETKAGILSIHIDNDGRIMMEQNKPEYYDFISKNECSFINDLSCINEPIQIISTGLKDIIMPIKNDYELDKLNLNYDALTSYSALKDVVGLHAFTTHHPYKSIDAIARNFAPLYGINEESATGTSNCALAAYLFKYVQKKSSYQFLQGITMKETSHIFVDIEYDSDITKIFVGGYGKIIDIIKR